MSSRIIPFVALSIMLLVIAGAVVASAQELQPIPQPGQQQYQQQPQPGQPGQGFAPGAEQLNQNAGQPVQQQPAAQAPFTLAPQDEAVLDRVLTDWQNLSGSVKTFEAKFSRWDYDGVFGAANPGEQPKPKRVVDGKLKYAAPDKGLYELDDASEKWVCTGTSVFEFRADLKQVREHTLPPQMQGQAISDGPMPFVFGVEAAKMRARYWMRIVTPQDQQADKVWLEVFPKYAKDAANFERMYVVLSFAHQNGTVTKLEPYALNMYLPNGKDRTVYQFREMKPNGVINNFNAFLNVFVRPTTPFGWQHVLMDEQGPAGGQPPTAQQQQQPAPLGIGNAPQPGVQR